MGRYERGDGIERSETSSEATDFTISSGRATGCNYDAF